MSDDAHDDPKHLEDLMDPGTTLMVGAGTPLDFRPLTVARVERDRIDVVIDDREHWAAVFRDHDPVHVTLSDDRSSSWASIRGTGTLSKDPALIDELWNPFAAAYFDEGRESPGVAAFTIRVDEGRYWATASGRIGSLISVVRAALGSAEDSGEHGDIAV